MKFIFVALFMTFSSWGVDFQKDAFSAVSEGKIDVLEQMFKEKKVNPNIQNQFGKSLLHYAVILNKPSMVQWLIQNKASVNVLDRQNFTPLLYATHKSFSEKQQRRDQFEIVKKLLESNADVSIQNKLKEDALMNASYNGELRIVKLLLDQKSVSLKNKNLHKQTALHTTVLGANALKRENSNLFDLKLKNYQTIVQYLLNKGTDVNAVDSEKRAPFHYMAEYGFSEMLKNSLKQKNIQINLQTEEGWSALHLSAGTRNVKNIELLISHGADVNLKDKMGMTPIYMAVGAGSKEAVGFLLKAKANIFFKDKDGRNIFDDKTSEKLKGLISKFKGAS